MKKIFYFFFGLFLSIFYSNTTAQITLDNSDAPQIGDVFINAHDTTNIDTLLSIATGEDVAWDFSWIINDYQDTTTFVDPASTPNGATFPTATLAQYFQQNYFYLLCDQNQMVALGGQFDTLTIPFEDPLTILVFPLSYNTIFSDTGILDFRMAYDTTISGVQIDSIRFKRIMVINDTVTGWGSLTTPAATYNDVLQLKAVETDIDTIFIHTTGFFSTWVTAQNSIDTSIKWEWLTTNKRTDLVTLDMSGDTLKKSSYFLDVTTNFDTKESNNANLTIFPNPANNIVSIQSDKVISLVKIYNVKGELLQSKSVSNHTFSVKNLLPGNYLIKLYDRSQQFVGTKKLVISH